MRGSKSLDDESATPPPDTPPVSIVIPARNERHNIERCLKSVLSTSYPAVEIVVVDDGSNDGTGDVAREAASNDARVRVIRTDGLPGGWFGKQWACETGARSSQGEIILFTDADTVHASDLVTRSVNAMLRRSADLFSVLGRQELGSFWERLVQPQVFSIMSVRYGGTESVTQSGNVKDKIANGQCLFVRRDSYKELGGHALVKSHVAEDMMMAQRYFAHGKRVVLAEGLNQLSTRMYASLRELIHGWSKNVFAGGRDAVPMGVIGQMLFPFLLLSGPLIGLLPAVILLAATVVAVSQSLLLWALITQAALLAWWTYIYRSIREPLWYVLLSPLGAAVTLYIFARAILRGNRVMWKDREYISS